MQIVCMVMLCCTEGWGSFGCADKGQQCVRGASRCDVICMLPHCALIEREALMGRVRVCYSAAVLSCQT